MPTFNSIVIHSYSGIEFGALVSKKHYSFQFFMFSKQNVQLEYLTNDNTQYRYTHKGLVTKIIASEPKFSKPIIVPNSLSSTKIHFLFLLYILL